MTDNYGALERVAPMDYNVSSSRFGGWLVQAGHATKEEIGVRGVEDLSRKFPEAYAAFRTALLINGFTFDGSYYPEKYR